MHEQTVVAEKLRKELASAKREVKNLKKRVFSLQDVVFSRGFDKDEEDEEGGDENEDDDGGDRYVHVYHTPVTTNLTQAKSKRSIKMLV